MQKKWTPGKIVALVFGCIGAGIALLVAIYISIFQISANILFLDSIISEDPYKEDQGKDHSQFAYDSEKDDTEKDVWNEPEEKAGNDDSQYYDFHSEIKNDLSYQIEIEEFADPADENGRAMLSGNCPVVSCEDQGKEERINSAIHKEIEEVFDYVSQLGEELPEGTYFSFEMESYVTYMDEDVLSVIYEEYGYLDDEMYESYVVSVNFDMESGMQLTNSQILDIDDTFSIDFRERNEKQNGEVQGLEYYSDQDITQMLNDDDSLIIFYTPLGMEVGINYYYGWVTVTYPDYKKFSNPF